MHQRPLKADETARRLTSIPGVGPIIAATARAVIQDPAAFRSGRDLAAWIGITPQANSSGGKERIGRISKRGNKQLRTLLIVGATSILKQARRGAHLPSWIISLMRRRPYKVVAVALADKMARTIWAQGDDRRSARRHEARAAAPFEIESTLRRPRPRYGSPFRNGGTIEDDGLG